MAALARLLIPLLRILPASVLVVLNRFIINSFASSTPPRPHRFSLWTPSKPTTPVTRRVVASRTNADPKPDPVSPPEIYASWPSLVDRTFTARHLPPAAPDERKPLPRAWEVLPLFERNGAMPSARSSLLFCFFAQWFTDSFLRTHPSDPRRNTSNHEIDLCQIYGLDEQSTWALRTGRDGRLKSRMVEGNEYPPLLFQGDDIDPQFYDPDPVHERGLTYVRAGRLQAWKDAIEGSLPGAISEPGRRGSFYASGLDRGNSTIVYSALNTIFLREHNSIAGKLAAKNADWDDNRLFETARLINIRQVLRVVVNDYIRHIGGSFPFDLDRTFAEKRPWYRSNRISIEFNLLYRWHSLVPDTFVLDGKPLTHRDYRFNNALLERHGVEQVVSDASAQKAGRIGLFNTPEFLMKAEERGLKWARDFGLQPFNRYRERFGLAPYESIEELADGPDIARALRDVYGDDVDAVEFTVGLLAEKRRDGEVMAETLTQMVAYDAFTHIFTNPVLSSEVHLVETFSKTGMEIIEEGASLEAIIRRNTDKTKSLRVSLGA